MISFFIENTQIHDIPDGWDRGQSIIEIDDDIKLRFNRYEPVLTFYGDGAAILRDAWNSNFNQQLNVRVVVRGRQYDGIIYISDIEWSRKYKTAQVKVRDNGFETNVKSFLDTQFSYGNKSRNGVTLAAATITANLHDVATGAWTFTNRRSIDVLAMTQNIIGQITDGRITALSNQYNTQFVGDSFNVFVLLTGLRIRTNVDPYPVKVSLRQMLQFFWRQFAWKSALVIESGNLVLRIEPEAYWENIDNAVELTDFEDYSRTGNIEEFYSGINAGSLVYKRDDGATLGLPYVPFFGFGNDTMAIRGNASAAVKLDLTCPFISDSNIIESVLGGNTDYDDEVFVINLSTLFRRSVNTAYFPSVPKFLYNEKLLNYRIIERHRFHDKPVVNYNVNDRIGAWYRKGNNFDSSAPQTITDFPFEDDGSIDVNTFGLGLPTDPPFNTATINNVNGYYSLVTYRYNVPASGAYAFGANFEFEVVGLLSVRINFLIYDASNVLVQTINGTLQFYGTDTRNVSGIQGAQGETPVISLPINYKVSVQLICTPIISATYKIQDINTYTLANGNQLVSRTSFFQIYTLLSGGEIKPQAGFHAEIINIQTNIPDDDWEKIRNNPANSVILEGRKCTIKNAERNNLTGETQLIITTPYDRVNT